MEKAKSALTAQVQVDRSALNRATDDKLVKVQSAIEVFTTEIQMIMSSLSENNEALSDADLGISSFQICIVFFIFVFLIIFVFVLLFLEFEYTCS